MAEAEYPLVDALEIVRLVGRPAFERARPYTRGRSVRDVVWKPGERVLTADVTGSEPFSYHCRIVLDEKQPQGWVPRHSTCSCPVQFDCKHVAATLIVSNSLHLAARSDLSASRWPGADTSVSEQDLIDQQSYGQQVLDEAAGRSGSMMRPAQPGPWPVRYSDPGAPEHGVGGPGAPARGSVAHGATEWYPSEPRFSAPAEPRSADWRDVVGSLAGGGAASGAGGSSSGTGGAPRRPRANSAPTAMGMQFEVREFVARTHEQWRGPAARTAVPTKAGDDPLKRPPRRLGVRPVIRNGAGTYVKANVSWASFTHQVNRLNLEPRHLRWFAEFAAVHRATRELYTGGDTDWLYVDDFASPLLWHLLDEAGQLGIPLLGTKKAVHVHLASGARVTLDAASLTSGALRLAAVVDVDGVVSEAGAVGAIGEHGVYTYELGATPSITLAPVVGDGLLPEARALLGQVSELVVPVTEVAEFFEEFYPRLRQKIDVSSADASVRFPEIAAPVLVLTARFRAKNVLGLDWAWEYGGDEKPRRVPLLPGDGSADGARGGSAGGGSVGVDSAGGAAVGRGGSAGEYRDEVTEQATLARVRSIIAGDDLDEEPLNPSLALQGYDTAVFAEKTLPLLEAEPGVRVDIVGTRPDYRELTGDPELTITTVESDKRDWFDLGVVVNMNGYTIPFGPLFKALAKGEKRLLMVDKTYLTLDHPAFDRLRELLAEASTLDEWETGVRIAKYQASLWSDFEDLAEETVQAVAWRDAVSGLNELTSIRSTPLPAGVNATLRPYQLDGFNWLVFLFEHGLGGVLADDMGLGKTLQTLALLEHARSARVAAAAAVDGPSGGDAAVAVPGGGDAAVGGPSGAASAVSGARGGDAASAGPFLVVAPTSVVSNWAVEAAHFTPGLVVRTITATGAKSKQTLAEQAEGADVIVTSYTLFRLDFARYQALPWAGLILDEAQFVKNHQSKLHVCAADLDAPFKLAITGTPLENNLMELWSLFAIVAPGLFASAPKFTEGYVKPIERGFGAVLMPKLRRRIRPLIMRRTKELVAPELPAKQEQVLQITLAPAHQKLYDAYFQRERQKLLGLVDDLDRNRFIVFRSLTLLRMLSLDASLIDEKYSAVPSSKLDALFEQLDDVVAEGHRALIFSQFTSFLGKAAARLDDAGIAYEYLDGSTRRRADVITRFKDGTAPVFLISLKAGGFGLNLTEADYVFMLDPWWNPQAESQAIDRTHRIGQTKSVNVYRLVATGTIEEKVMALKAQKSLLFDAVLDDDAVFSTALTAEDIRGLLDA